MIPEARVMGIWVRKRGPNIEVLAEVDGLWRVLDKVPWGSFLAENEHSRIIEPQGIYRAPFDPVTNPAPTKGDEGHE
jgi:hypothetical protein